MKIMGGNALQMEDESVSAVKFERSIHLRQLAINSKLFPENNKLTVIIFNYSSPIPTVRRFQLRIFKLQHSIAMSFATTPAYIYSIKGWEKQYREIPVIDWMFDYEAAFDWGDMKSGPHTPWHADDFSYTKPTGVCVTGGEAAWAALLEGYSPFSSHYHEPFFFIIWDTPTGYGLFGCAKVFGKLHAPGELTKTDLEGRKWDVEIPGAFLFEYVKDPSGPKGLKLKSQKLFADGVPVICDMIKRGMVTIDQVMARAAEEAPAS